MNLRKITTSLIATMAVISLSACFEKKDTKEVKPADNRVEVTKPLVKDIEVWDEYTARIEGEKSVEVRSRVSGYLEKICFTDGDFVKAGDILFEIDPRPFEAMVEASQASVKETEARIELAESNLKRAQELYRANAISREVLETRKSELLSAKAVLMSAQAKLKDAMLNLEFTKTRSPISGYVSRRRVDEGNLIDASTTLMATVVSRDIVYAYFEISERDIIKYTSSRLFESINASERSGPPVKLKLLDENTPSHTGCLTYVDNTLNASSIELRADIENSKGKLFPGMFGVISLRSSDPVKRILLPESAIGTDLVGRYVFVVNKDNIVEYRKVEVGEIVGKMQIITSGITPEDCVIINGFHKAKAGRKITPIMKELKD